MTNAPQSHSSIDRIGNFKLQTPSEYFAEQKAKAAGEAARAPTPKNIPRPTDNEIDDWNHRHGLHLTIGDARQAFEDAATSEYAKGVRMNAHAGLVEALEAAIPHLESRADSLHGESLECTGKTSLDLRATSQMVHALAAQARAALASAKL